MALRWYCIAFFLIFPSLAWATCSGSLNCPAFNSDQSNCQGSGGSQVCTWTGSTCSGSLDCTVWNSDQRSCQATSACTWFPSSGGCSDPYCGDQTSCENACEASGDGGGGCGSNATALTSDCNTEFGNSYDWNGLCIDIGGDCLYTGIFGTCGSVEATYTDQTSCEANGYTWTGSLCDGGPTSSCDSANLQWYACPDLAPLGCDNNGGCGGNCGGTWGGTPTSCADTGGYSCATYNNDSTSCGNLSSAGCTFTSSSCANNGTCSAITGGSSCTQMSSAGCTYTSTASGLWAQF